SREYFAKGQVPFGLKRIDLVFKRKHDTSEIVAVELKLRDWRRAVWQAVHNRQVATYSYIALPSKCVSAVDKLALAKLGLGLIRVDVRSATIFLNAAPSRYVNSRMSDEISKIVERSSDA